MSLKVRIYIEEIEPRAHVVSFEATLPGGKVETWRDAMIGTQHQAERRAAFLISTLHTAHSDDDVVRRLNQLEC